MFEKTYQNHRTMRRASGIIILAKSTKKILLSERSRHLPQAGSWTGWGGWNKPGEDPFEGAMRELIEETAFNGIIIEQHTLSVYQSSNFNYHNFLLIVEDEFEPKTDWESANHGWYHFEDLPKPLHFGFKWMIAKDAHTINGLIQKF